LRIKKLLNIFLMFIFSLFLVNFILFLPVFADSLWNQNSPSPYSSEKTYKIGDIITVLIVENTNAKHKAGTDTDVKDDMSFKFTHTINSLIPLIDQNNSAAFNNGNKYSGSGSTQRASSVTAKVAAIVMEVLPNGNISIEGSHKISINDEMQEVVISGIVRAKDITANNVVYSYQIANANVSVTGVGVVQEAEDPGWLTRVLNWLF